MPAVHVQRVEDDMATDGTAHTTTDQWFDARSGLVLREVATLVVDHLHLRSATSTTPSSTS